MSSTFPFISIIDIGRNYKKIATAAGHYIAILILDLGLDLHYESH